MGRGEERVVISFADQLWRLREGRSLSQSDLARKAGLAPSALSRLESGDRHPDRDTLTKLAEALTPMQPAERDLLYAAAGYLPPDTEWSPAWQALREVMAAPNLDDAEKEAFEMIISKVAAQMLAPT